MFSQEHPEWAGQVASMGLCALDDPAKLKDAKASATPSDEKVIDELMKSPWLRIDPATEGLTVPADGDKPAKYYTSRGFATEQVKLFTIVFNAFVFMQVFNQINARKLELGEWNVFSGMCSNLPFLGIMIVPIGATFDG